MNRKEKEQVISDLQKQVEQVKAVVLTNYRGLTVGQMDQLRRRLREEKITYSVAKNTMMKLASKGSALEKLNDYFEGPTAIAMSSGDPLPCSFATDADKFGCGIHQRNEFACVCMFVKRIALLRVRGSSVHERTPYRCYTSFVPCRVTDRLHTREKSHYFVEGSQESAVPHLKLRQLGGRCGAAPANRDHHYP